MLRTICIDGRAVLRAGIVALAHALRRVVAFPENPEQLVVAHDLRVKDHQHHFGVVGQSRAHFIVGRVLRLAAGVADCGRVHAGGLPEQALGAPEAAHAEHGALQAFWKRRLQRMPIHEMLRRDLQRRRAARERALRWQQLGHLLPERENLHDYSKTLSVPVYPSLAPCICVSTAPSLVTDSWWRVST